MIGNSVHVMCVLTGEAYDAASDDGKDKAAQAMGRKSDAAQAGKPPAGERSEIAKKAAPERRQ